MAKETSSRPTADRRWRVLIVDDEPLVLNATRRMLERDHEVVAVARAQDALELLWGAKPFDLVLSDVMMSEMTGIDLYQRVAQTVPSYLPRIAFFTGGFPAGPTGEFLKNVGNRCIAKPISSDELCARVGELLAQLQRNE